MMMMMLNVKAMIMMLLTLGVLCDNKKTHFRSHVFELAVEGWQAEEAILAIFHPVLFHRTTGKFTYQVSTQSI